MKTRNRLHYLASLLTADKRKVERERKQGQTIRTEFEQMLYPIQEKVAQIQTVLENGVKLFDCEGGTAGAPKQQETRTGGKVSMKRLCNRSIIYWEVHKYAEEQFRDKKAISDFFAMKSVKDYIESIRERQIEDGIATLKQMIRKKAQEIQKLQKTIEFARPTKPSRQRPPALCELFTTIKKKKYGSRSVARIRSTTLEDTTSHALVTNIVSGEIFPRVPPNKQSSQCFPQQQQTTWGVAKSSVASNEAMRKVGEYARRLSANRSSKFLRRKSVAQEPSQLSSAKKLLKQQSIHAKRNSVSPYYKKANSLVKECDRLHTMYNKAEKGCLRMKDVIRRSISSMEENLLEENADLTTKEIERIIAERTRKSQCFIYGRSGKGRFIPCEAPSSSSQKDGKGGDGQLDYRFARKYLRCLADQETIE